MGDRVLLSTEHLKLIGERKRARKLTERYIGPYRVKRVVNANAYELELPASLKIHPVINISHLKEYRDGAQAFPDRPVTLTRPPPEALDDNGAPEWLVDRLLDHRTVKRGARQTDQYLVEWKGYPISEATWEPLENLTGVIKLVNKFNQQRNVQLSAVQTILQRSFAAVARASTAEEQRSGSIGAGSSASRTKRSLLSTGGCNRPSPSSIEMSEAKKSPPLLGARLACHSFFAR